jgi:uncharacterized membrane protein YbhN (UPF0104 family)
MNLKKLTPYLTTLFILVVAYVLFQSLSRLDWKIILQAVQEVPIYIFLPGIILSLVNYAILSHFDYMGVRFFKFSLSYWRTVFSAFFCYVFNLNLGSIVGGLAFRFRIYTGWGLSKDKVPFILIFSTLTNWTGYLLLLSLLMLFESMSVAHILNFPIWSLRLSGIVGTGLVIVYFVLCMTGREIMFKGKAFHFPDWKLCLVQIVSSCTQWALMALIVFYFLLYFKVEVTYQEVLFTYLMASVAGLIAHIPAGLGVIEAVFLKLQINANSEDLVVALICFRIVYYLVPLIIALPGYLYLEVFQKTQLKQGLIKDV